MNKENIVRFLNIEWDKVKHSTEKVRGFYKKHSGLIDLAVVESSIPALLASGLNPSIIIPVIGGETIGWGIKTAYDEKRRLGGGIFDAGMTRERRLKEVI